VKQSKHAYDGLRRIPARDLLAASEAEAARGAEAALPTAGAPARLASGAAQGAEL
jgi:hypothetical protein